MKLIFFIIATYLLLMGLGDCVVEKRIQVKTIFLTVKSIKPDGDRKYHIVWIDDKEIEYDMYCDCPHYKPGYIESFLITR